MSDKRFADLPARVQSEKRLKMQSTTGKVGVAIRRTSRLFAPIIRIEDHRGSVNSCKFHPNGRHILSGGTDKSIYMRNVFDGNYLEMTMNGHEGPIMSIDFSGDGSKFYTGSMDNSIGIWNTDNGEMTKRLKYHKCHVNTVQSNKNSETVICSGSNDGTVCLWDIRDHQPTQVLNSGFQILSSCFNDRGDHVITAGVESTISIWDLRMNRISAVLYGHDEMVTGLAMSPCGSYLLSNCLDNTLRIWNMRPFKHDDDEIVTFPAHQSFLEPNLLKCTWSRDGKYIAAGGSDTRVYIWNWKSRDIAYRLEGHGSSVIDVDFHPSEPILASGSSYEGLYLHEL